MEGERVVHKESHSPIVSLLLLPPSAHPPLLFPSSLLPLGKKLSIPNISVVCHSCLVSSPSAWFQCRGETGLKSVNDKIACDWLWEHTVQLSIHLFQHHLTTIWSHDYRLWSHDYIMWSHDYIMWSHDCIMWSHDCIMRSHVVQFSVHSVPPSGRGWCLKWCSRHHSHLPLVAACYPSPMGERQGGKRGGEGGGGRRRRR